MVTSRATAKTKTDESAPPSPTLTAEENITLPLLIDGSRNGTPIVDATFGVGVNYSAIFTRRDDHGQPGSVEYTVQFSSDLTTFHDSTDTPIFVADSADDPAYEIVKVPYPLFTLDGQKARFFRVVVTAGP